MPIGINRGPDPRIRGLVREALEAAAGVRLAVLHIIGGGSRNDLLNRFTADALNLPVIAGPVEATALGNLAVQAVAADVIPDLAAARALIRRSFPLKTYEPHGPAEWDEAFGRFQRVV
jgi:rhamnulokinase